MSSACPSVTYTAIAVAMFSLYTVVVCSMAEQAELRDRQEQKVSELVKKLEASNSDRDSLAKKYQDAEGDLETVKSELAQTQTE